MCSPAKAIKKLAIYRGIQDEKADALQAPISNGLIGLRWRIRDGFASRQVALLISGLNSVNPHCRQEHRPFSDNPSDPLPSQTFCVSIQGFYNSCPNVKLADIGRLAFFDSLNDPIRNSGEYRELGNG